MVTYSCGGCSGGKMCKNCMESSLLASGIPVTEENLNVLRNVKDPGHGQYFGGYNNYTFALMELEGDFSPPMGKK